jgi:hypothetical protein
MLKILNLLPIKIISATINHLPLISTRFFYGSARQLIQKRTKGYRSAYGTGVVMDLDQGIGK